MILKLFCRVIYTSCYQVEMIHFERFTSQFFNLYKRQLLVGGVGISIEPKIFPVLT